MYKEYAKFRAPRGEYNPAISDDEAIQEHFSHYPDVLIPKEYKEESIDEDQADKQDTGKRKSKNKNEDSPDENDPGIARCQVFYEKKYYVAPCYKDPVYMRWFMAKLILLDMAYFVPSVVLFIIAIVWRRFEADSFQFVWVVVSVSAACWILMVLFIYFVGLFRNPPYLYIALAARAIITTGVFGLGSLIMCDFALYLLLNEEQRARFDAESSSESDDRLYTGYGHTPPYMGLLTVMIMLMVQGMTAFLLIKYKFEVTDYRLAFIIYTICFTLSPLLMTMVLNDLFHGEPKGYDVFQIMMSCFMSAVHLIRTPDFINRLVNGKICPLRKDELFYALIHFGM